MRKSKQVDHKHAYRLRVKYCLQVRKYDTATMRNTEVINDKYLKLINKDCVLKYQHLPKIKRNNNTNNNSSAGLEIRAVNKVRQEEPLGPCSLYDSTPRILRSNILQYSSPRITHRRHVCLM